MDFFIGSISFYNESKNTNTINKIKDEASILFGELVMLESFASFFTFLKSKFLVEWTHKGFRTKPLRSFDLKKKKSGKWKIPVDSTK